MRSQAASWSVSIYSSGLCPCSMCPGPQTAAGTPSKLWKSPASVPKATLHAGPSSPVIRRRSWMTFASSLVSRPG
ncbi:hypothetical protein D3C72_2317690 [compost metagenome]